MPQVPLESKSSLVGANVAGAVDAALENAQKKIETLGDGVKHFNDQRDTAAALEAYNKSAGEVRAFLNDPNDGILVQRGRDATGVGRRTQQHLADRRNEALASLSKRQQPLFAKLFDANAASVLERVAAHELDEHATRMRDTLKDGIATATDDAIENFSDPETIGKAIVSINGNIDALAGSAGLGIEETERLRGESLSALHVGVLDALGRRDPGAGLAYLNDFGGQIEAQRRNRLERALDAMLEERAVADAVDEQLAQRALTGQAVRSFSDSKLQARVDEGVRDRMAQLDAARRAERDDAYSGARSVIEATGELGNVSPRDRTRLEDAGLWPALVALSRRLLTGERVPDNPGLRYDLMRTALDEPSAFAELNLLSVHDAGFLSEDDLQKLQALGDGNSRASKATRAARLLERNRIDATLRQAGIVRGSDGYEERRAAFLKQWDAHSLQIESRENRLPSFEEMTEIGAAALLDVEAARTGVEQHN